MSRAVFRVLRGRFKKERKKEKKNRHPAHCARSAFRRDRPEFNFKLWKLECSLLYDSLLYIFHVQWSAPTPCNSTHLDTSPDDIRQLSPTCLPPNLLTELHHHTQAQTRVAHMMAHTNGRSQNLPNKEGGRSVEAALCGAGGRGLVSTRTL